MFVGDETLPFGQVQHAVKEFPRHVGTQQAVAVDAEARAIPDRVVHGQSDKPAEQQVVVELFHQLPFAAHGEQDLQQQGAEQLFRGNRGAPGVGIALVEQLAHAGENAVDQDLHAAQWMVRGNSFVQADIAEHGRLLGFKAAHSIHRKLGRCFRPQFARIPAASKGRGVSHQPDWMNRVFSPEEETEGPETLRLSSSGKRFSVRALKITFCASVSCLPCDA